MNGARGEVELVVDGRAHTLCLTLGALAEIETALGCDTLAELQVRLKQLSAREIMRVLTALLRGGGAGDTELASQVSPGAAAVAVAEAFRAALG